jgi:hypothetical protein
MASLGALLESSDAATSAAKGQRVALDERRERLILSPLPLTPTRDRICCETKRVLEWQFETFARSCETSKEAIRSNSSAIARSTDAVGRRRSEARGRNLAPTPSYELAR